MILTAMEEDLEPPPVKKAAAEKGPSKESSQGKQGAEKGGSGGGDVKAQPAVQKKKSKDVSGKGKDLIVPTKRSAAGNTKQIF
jgi:hypothetical protein